MKWLWVYFFIFSEFIKRAELTPQVGLFWSTGRIFDNPNLNRHPTTE